MPRSPKPILIHKAEGTYRKDRHARKVALTPEIIGDPPEWMEEDARVEWERLTKHSQYSQVLSQVHRGTLEEYCLLYGRMIQDAKGKYEMSARERMVLNSLRLQLGITPTAQSKIKLPEAKEKAGKFSEFVVNA